MKISLIVIPSIYNSYLIILYKVIITYNFVRYSTPINA